MTDLIPIRRELLERALKADASIGATSIELVDGWKAMAELRAALAAPVHPDDAAVDAFAAAMKAKLAKARAKGRGGWDDKAQCSQQYLSDLLRGHVDKGDPVDVANFCMMLSPRGEGIAAPATAQSVNAQLLELLKWLRGSINCNTENDTGRHGVWFSTQHPMIQRIDAAIAAARKGEQ